jgi:hypothetical protein
MKHLGQLLARRAVIKGAGLGLVAGTLADAMSVQGAHAEAPQGEI